MLNEKCYGIISDANILFNAKELKKQLEYTLRCAIHDGANTFIVGANNKFDEIALNVCKSLRKRYKNKEIRIKVVLTDINIVKSPEKHSSILQYYENEHLIFVYAESQTEEEKYYRTQQFIVNNSFKCFGFVDETNIKKLNGLSTYPSIIVNLYNNKEITVKKNLNVYTYFDTDAIKNITLL